MTHGLRLRFANASLWFGASGGGSGSIEPMLDGVFDQALLETITVLRTLPHTGRAPRYCLRFTLLRRFADGQLTCSAGVEGATLRSLVTFAAARHLDPVGATVLDMGKEIPRWRYVDGVRALRWKRPEDVEEDIGHVVSVEGV